MSDSDSISYNSILLDVSIVISQLAVLSVSVLLLVVLCIVVGSWVATSHQFFKQVLKRKQWSAISH